MLIQSIAHHVPMREHSRLFELVAPTDLTCLAPLVAGVVEITLCHALVQAVVGVTECGGMFCAHLEQSFKMVPGSGGLSRVVRA
jgi:hypothetical protein